MDAPDRDPLRDLAAAWRAAEPPAAGGDLADEPAEVRAAVARVRAAWDAVAAPAAARAAARDALAARAAVRRAPPAPARLARPLVAAAALLVLLGAAAWLGLRGRAQDEGGRRLAAGPRPAPEAFPGPTGPTGPAARPGPRVAALAPDRIEMRSGNVRLVLLTGGAPEAFPDRDRTRSEGTDR